MQGCDIFLAGGEIEKLTRSLLDNGIKHLLYSYYYILRFSKEGFVDRMKQEYPDVKWFLDSGAFTYASVVASGGNRKLPPPERYKELYFDYVRDFGRGFYRIAELDVDNVPTADGTVLVEYEQVKEWLEELLVTFPDYPVMPTYHGWRPREDWTAWCNDPRIRCMAIGRGTQGLGRQRMLVMEAQEAKKPVHGFAMTKFQSTLKLIPYDSVDSSSWVMGQKYGLTYVFMGNRWKVLTGDEKRYRRRYRQYFQSIGVNYELIEADNVDELRKSNVIAWRNLSARYSEMKKRRNALLGMEDVVGLDDSMVDDGDIGDEAEKVVPAIIAPPSPRLVVPRPVSSPQKTIISPTGGTTRIRARPLAGFGIGIQDPTRRKYRE